MSGPDAEAQVGLFHVTESHDDAPHEFHIIEPTTPDWLSQLAARYRDLRTHSDLPLSEVQLDGITILSTQALERRMVEATIPPRRGGNFDVLRSDLGEMALAVHGEETYEYTYGYRSVRDRETVPLPGRGIDQIGVAETEDPLVIVVVLGEAKVSSQRQSPPRVVDQSEDCLRVQHLGHVSEVETTANKIMNAARRATDPRAQKLLLLAAELMRQQLLDNLVICCHSLVARPNKLADQSDYGSFKYRPTDYAPARIRFTILRLPGDDVEAIIDQFGELARGNGSDAIEAQGEA